MSSAGTEIVENNNEEKNGVEEDELTYPEIPFSYVCFDCNTTFPDNVQLMSHECSIEVKKVDSKKSRYPCEYCEYTFPVPSKLKRHMKTHSGKKAFNCDECEFATNREANFMSHVQSHAPNSCHVCRQIFPTPAKLKAHMKTHGEKPYSCEFCSYNCDQAGKLKVHMRTHTGERPYPCPHCSHAFSKAWNLKVHIKTHMRNLICKYCDHRAHSLPDFRTHALTHADLETGKLHYCPDCSYSSNQIYKLKRHMKTHK